LHGGMAARLIKCLGGQFIKRSVATAAETAVVDGGTSGTYYALARVAAR